MGGNGLCGCLYGCGFIGVCVGSCECMSVSVCGFEVCMGGRGWRGGRRVNLEFGCE